MAIVLNGWGPKPGAVVLWGFGGPIDVLLIAPAHLCFDVYITPDLKLDVTI